MRDYEVTCISRFGRNDTHEAITHVGNDLEKWRLSVRSVIERIESGFDAFYTINKNTGVKVYIGIVRPPGWPPYLRTRMDEVWTNELLALPKCSPDCRAFW